MALTIYQLKIAFIELSSISSITFFLFFFAVESDVVHIIGFIFQKKKVKRYQLVKFLPHLLSIDYRVVLLYSYTSLVVMVSWLSLF